MSELTVSEAGGFWVLCRAGFRHRVTAYRVVRRSGGGFRATTRLSLSGWGEVRRVEGSLYRCDRLGALLRLGWSGPMA